jgi:hypothetical protein
VVAFIVLVASQIFALLFGFGIACAARRQPWVANAIIGAVVLAGFEAIWAGGELALAGLGAGLYLIVTGLIIIFAGVPSWSLVPEVRRANGLPGSTAWARLLGMHLAACWFFVVFLGLPVFIFVQLAAAPPGSLR